MTMLIKGGLIHTMTAQGSLVGDILIRKDRIVAVSPCISEHADSGTCILHAEGLTILPGLMDVHIHDRPEVDASLLQRSQAPGVTTGLLWPAQEGCCRLICGSHAKKSSVYVVMPGEYTDEQLPQRFQSLANGGYSIACEIHAPAQCRLVLDAAAVAGVRVILAHLTGCETMLEEVAGSGCPVILGVNHQRSGNPWAMACSLERYDAQIALTCNHPDAKLCHLPVCAALCAREGADRESVLHMMTTAPAAICGLQDRGVIKPGARADFAIYDGDPLLLSTSHVMTIVGGKIRH